MSLDTVLKIGKALRQSKDSLKYFKYVAPPFKKKKDGTIEYPICITIPVKEDFTFDWNNVHLTPENKRDELYYLKFKTSDSDGMVKYIFGDIYYGQKSTIKINKSIETKEIGYYRLANSEHSNKAYQSSSFYRGISDYHQLVEKSATLRKFHESLEKEINKVETILRYAQGFDKYLSNFNEYQIDDLFKNKELIEKYELQQKFESVNKQTKKKLEIEIENYEELNETQKQKLLNFNNYEIFIHFDFNSKNWYDFNQELELINGKILSDFVEETKKGIVLNKTIYKTLCSGDKKNDIQFPDFSSKNKYKSKTFTNEQLQDLFYAIVLSGKGKLILGTGIKKIVLPKGENLNADNYLEFFDKQNEDITKERNKEAGIEPLFDFIEPTKKDVLSFDIVFCKKGGTTSPDIDLIEISNIEKSKLRQTMERIAEINKFVKREKQKYLNTKKAQYDFRIETSFRNILGSYYYDEKKNNITIKSNPKYQSHLLKVLPLIYTDNYYNDEVLLPSFIQNIETSIRFGNPQYVFLKFDLMFLFKIQNSKNDKYMEITNSKSYQIGLKAGKIAKPLKNAINSFEKSYVGLISRRTSTIDECISFLNEIDQKLIMHAKHYGKSISAEIRNELANLSFGEYDKEKFIFGFFEGYFKYEAKDKKNDFVKTLEKLVNDYTGNEELQNEVEQLNSLVEEMKEESN